MNRIKISVAVPVYNAANHLDVLFDSLKNQTMPAADFEIICVNDCSTDNSKEVVEMHARTMGNIILINRSENSGGPVLPRNNAIDAARGEYIHFLDNDDFLGEEALERLYKAAQANGSDVIYGRYVGVNGSAPSVVMFKNGTRLKADLLADNLVYSLTPHKMFRLSFLKEHGFKFDPNANAGNDDQLFLMQCFLKAHVITVLADYPYYFVVSRSGGNLSSNFVPAASWLYTWHRIMEFLNEAVPDEAYNRKVKIALLNRLLVRTRFRTFLLTNRTTLSQKAEWLQEAKKFIDTHTDNQLIESLDPQYQDFWQAVKNNDLAKLAELTDAAKPAKRNAGLNIVKTKRAGVVSYKRPSVKALSATTYSKAGQELTVHPTINDWYEIRRVENGGVRVTEFIRKKDTLYTVKYLVSVMVTRIRKLQNRQAVKSKGR